VAALVSGFSQDSWVVRAGIEALDPASQYIRSLYWTIATITTVGYGDITPGHTAEYAVALVVMITGASLYAFLIGSIASLLSNLNASQNRHKKRVMSVTQYLHDRDAPQQLSDRVRNYYDYLWARDKGQNDAELLNDLPGPLRLDVMLHITRNILQDAPLFQHCSDPLRNALLMALELQIYPPASYIVRKGEPGKQVYFVTDGRMEIIFGEDQSVYGEFGPGDYFGHISMVLGETRTASIRTLTYCDVYVLDQEKFKTLRSEFPEFSDVLKHLSVEKTEKVSKMLIEGIVL
jgi:voltage-gated potassium channel